MCCLCGEQTLLEADCSVHIGSGKGSKKLGFNLTMKDPGCPAEKKRSWRSLDKVMMPLAEFIINMFLLPRMVILFLFNINSNLCRQALHSKNLV